MKSYLLASEQTFGCSPCGEGGEYETFTLDCPLFKKRIVIDDFKLEGEELDRSVAPTGIYCILKCHTEVKSSIVKYGQDYPELISQSGGTSNNDSPLPATFPAETVQTWNARLEKQFCNSDNGKCIRFCSSNCVGELIFAVASGDISARDSGEHLQGVIRDVEGM